MKTLIMLVGIFLGGCSVGQFEMEQNPFAKQVAIPKTQTDLEQEADYAKKNHGIVSIHRHGPGYDVMLMLNAGESDIIFSMDLPPGGEASMPQISEQMQAQDGKGSVSTTSAGNKKAEQQQFFNKKALSLFSNATKHMLSAQALFYRKSYWKALEETNKAMSLVPSSAQAYALKGSIYYKLGRKKEAKRSWQKAFKLDPSLTEVKESLKLVN
ncbi:MAG: tetratricopeptide repeat protein [Bermanella sp.]|jgi:Tetratricopeptide repeat.